MNEGTSDRRGVEGHARELVEGAWNPLGMFSTFPYAGDPLAGIKPGRRSLVLSCRQSIPAGVNVLERLSATTTECGKRDAGRVGEVNSLRSHPAVSHFERGPARSGAVGGGWNSEASRQEAGALESAQDRAGGANG